MLPRAVVFDIDGVLCDIGDRIRAYAEANPHKHGEPWADFEQDLDDPSRPEWVQLAQLLSETRQVILLTCRQECTREDTKAWLDLHGVDHIALVMWDPLMTDYYEHKRTAIRRLMESFTIDLVVEDGTKHVDMFREHGLHVLHVSGGYSGNAEIRSDQVGRVDGVPA